jgi:aspartate/methionine/tyrosine aminotransferase
VHAGFVQRAGIAAVTRGDDVVARTRQRFDAAQRYLVSELNRLPRVRAAVAPGAMYAFFRVDGVDDSLDFCKRMVRDVGLGLAPAAPFGPEGEGFIRWCFAAVTSGWPTGYRGSRDSS